MNMEYYEEQIRRYNQMLLQMQQQAQPEVQEMEIVPDEPIVPCEPCDVIEPCLPELPEEIPPEIPPEEPCVPCVPCEPAPEPEGVLTTLAERIAMDLCNAGPEVQDCVLGSLIRADRGFWSMVRTRLRGCC